MGHTLSEDLEEMVTHLCQHAQYLSQMQKERLRSSMGFNEPEEKTLAVPETNYDATFDLGDEVEQQIKAVRAIRAQVFDENGRMRTDISSREAKEVISTGSTMLATLMKYHEKIMNMDRLRKLELSVMEALAEESQELQERVLALLEEKLLSDEIA
jgi:Mg2+ and Co2+ transporter CorA